MLKPRLLPILIPTLFNHILLATVLGLLLSSCGTDKEEPEPAATTTQQSTEPQSINGWTQPDVNYAFGSCVETAVKHNVTPAMTQIFCSCITEGFVMSMTYQQYLSDPTMVSAVLNSGLGAHCRSKAITEGQ